VLGDTYDDILEEARDGSSVALGAIYRDLFPSVLAYLRVRAPADAEDLTSDVFLDVARGLPRFAGDEGKFRGWVFTIARRRAIDAARRRSRRATDVVPADVLEAVVGPDDTEALALARIHTADALALVRRLPTGQAEVLLLRVVAGLSVDETAVALGRRAGAVRVAQHRALRRLARMLEGSRPGGQDDA
jgi:RNA polymerase sigma-70 factor, ECF subfamily